MSATCYIFFLSLPLQYDSGQLSNVVKMESLHSTLREDETVYWCKYLVTSLRSLQNHTNNKHINRHVYYYIACIHIYLLGGGENEHLEAVYAWVHRLLAYTTILCCMTNRYCATFPPCRGNTAAVISSKCSKFRIGFVSVSHYSTQSWPFFIKRKCSQINYVICRRDDGRGQ